MILHVQGLGAPQMVRDIAGEVRVLVSLSKDGFGSPHIHVSAAVRHEQVHVFRQNGLIAPLVHLQHALEASPVVVLVAHARIMLVGHILLNTLNSAKHVEFVVDDKTSVTPRPCRSCGAGGASLRPAHEVIEL